MFNELREIFITMTMADLYQEKTLEGVSRYEKIRKKKGEILGEYPRIH